jgi:PAB1-binding protein PBP1
MIKILPMALAAYACAMLLALTPAQAKSSSSHSSSHSASSYRASSHSSSGGSRSTSTSSRKPLPAGTHFVRKTCKTASCKAKHPGGSYMLPIKPKKSKTGAA